MMDSGGRRLKWVEKDVNTSLDCIRHYTRQAQEAIDCLSDCVDEEGAEAAIKIALRRIEGVRECVATMDRDIGQLREAWLAHHQGEEEGQE